jgi:vacuolar-type H+-ATPase subunit I/STV1
MPSYFKALATVGAWIMFIAGMVMGFSTFIMGIVNEDLFGSQVTPMEYDVAFAVAAFYVLAAVVIMILRKKMEK